MKTRTITIAAVIMILLSPLLVWGARHLHKRYQRYICGQNLKRLGKAQTVYANDYDDEYTVQGTNKPHGSDELWGILDTNTPPQPAKDPNGNWLY